ncbi:MAG: DUF2948 family protein [Hyphomicrobiales bacterium]|nr:DUF2948 family protein [Hyphomicrobiales bacterium]MDE2016612.1 DUF2948 family protein [Hyphomicrobiales bacterium]
MPAKPLRLHATDADDLEVLSAHAQDMVVRVEDMAFQPREARFALAGARFCRAGSRGPLGKRCLAGMHFDFVRKASRIGFDRAADGTANLLAIFFVPGEAPAGEVVLTFSDGALVRLTVDCVEAQMRDLTPAWPARAKPHHD